MDDLTPTLGAALVGLFIIAVATVALKLLRGAIEGVPVEPDPERDVPTIDESKVAHAVPTPPVDDDEPSRGDVVYLDDPAIHICSLGAKCGPPWTCESKVAHAVPTPPVDDDEPSRGDVVYLDDPAIHICSLGAKCGPPWTCESKVAHAVPTPPVDDDEPSRGDVVYLDDPAIHICSLGAKCGPPWTCQRCFDVFGRCVPKRAGDLCRYCAGRAA